MAQILTGRINLSKIPQDLIKRNNAGESFIWVDVVERPTPGTYGDTHYVSLYDKNARQRIYLADLRPRDIGGPTEMHTQLRPSAFPAQGTAPAPKPAPVYRPMSGADEDLPL